MLFNSIPFAIFFVVIFFLYWFIFSRNLKLQNFLILIGSYIFYCWWDWRFLSLLIGYSLLNYFLGLYIYKATNNRKKRILTRIGAIIGIGLLGYFKYTNFFISSFIAAFEKINIHLNIHTINVVLPLGISFYTFKALSYLFDINKGKFKPTNDIVVFFSYIAFFPCLLAGPIDKAQTLIPQLEQKRKFNYLYATDAMRQILWGLFKKIVIADNLTDITNNAFDNYQTLNASTLVLGTFLYSVQLYTDFSGYSDMAIGFARLLGFNITKNFDFPFFSQSVAEYWRKWHISLTQWLTEYVFTPLSITFRDYGKIGLISAILINLTVIGIWHGANWTFVVFGLLHGLYFIPLILKGTFSTKNKKTGPKKLLPSFKEFRNILQTFILVNIAFVFFRADSISQAFGFIGRIFSESIISTPTYGKSVLPIVILFFIVEWVQRDKQYALQIQDIKYIGLRWAIYILVFFMIFCFYNNDQTAFMYVKF